jgi:hypothetical protein
MFLSRKHLSRRTLLKGAGVSLGLPLLEAMLPAATALAQTAAAPKLRVGFFYIPHGAVQGDTRLGPDGDRWTPRGSAATFTLNEITRPLAPYSKYLTSIGNLKNDAGAGVHTRRPATWLGETARDLPNGPFIGPSLDQIIARRIGSNTPLPSLQLSSETTVQQAAGNGVNTAITLSFSDPATPMKVEFNPRQIFLKLFADDKSPAERRQIVSEEASLLDMIKDQTRALQNELGPGDRAVLDSHLTAVREAEQRLDTSSQAVNNLERAVAGIVLPPIPNGVQREFDEQLKLIFDLIAIAYRADLTRVVTFMMAAEGTNQTYNHIGVPDSFHPISHHADQVERLNKLARIQTWHVERFAEFLGKLATYREGEGTLLDNSLFLYGSNMGNSDKHSLWPLPTVLVGGVGGTVTGGRHIALSERTPIANLHLALLEKVGIQRTSFGDSTGTISL